MGNTNNSDTFTVGFTSRGVPRIGGWLRLLTLGLVLTILQGLARLAEAVGGYLEVDPEGMEIVGGLLAFEIFGAACATGLGVWLTWLLLKKRALFVKAYIGAMIAIHIINMADLAWLRSLVFIPPPEMNSMIGRIAAGIAASGIWVWYLLVSKRVKQTCIY